MAGLNSMPSPWIADMQWDVFHPMMTWLATSISVLSVLWKPCQEFFFSLSAPWKHRELNAIQFSWRILIQTYQPGFRILCLSLCVAPSGLVGFCKSILFWHWQKIFLIPCIKKRSNSKTINKPSKEKKIVLIANFEIIPWKRYCSILSALLPFYSLE